MKPSYKIIIPICSIYTLLLFIPTIDIAAIYHFNLLVFVIPFSVAAIVFPAIYPLSDSITEVYGKKVAYFLVIVCYVAAIIFSFTNDFLLSLSVNHVVYDFLLRSSILLTILGPIGYFTTSIINVKLLNKLKIKMRGKHFVLRSLACSSLSELVISFMIYPAIFYHQGARYIFLISISTAIVKMFLTIPMVFIARLLVVLYRTIDNIPHLPYSENLMDAANTLRGKQKDKPNMEHL